MCGDAADVSPVVSPASVCSQVVGGVVPAMDNVVPPAMCQPAPPCPQSPVVIAMAYEASLVAGDLVLPGVVDEVPLPIVSHVVVHGPVPPSVAVAEVLHGHVECAFEPPPPGPPVEVVEEVENSDDMRSISKRSHIAHSASSCPVRASWADVGDYGSPLSSCLL